MPDGSTRNPFTSAEQLTLADVLFRIEVDPVLEPQRRRNLCSAIRGLGKLIGKDLRYLPANPGFYRPFFKRLHPEHHGLSKSRIANIKSDVLFALRHLGCIQGARTYMAPLTEKWRRLWQSADCAGNQRRYASRFMHFCSAQGIGSENVGDAVTPRAHGRGHVRRKLRLKVLNWKINAKFGHPKTGLLTRGEPPFSRYRETGTGSEQTDL